MAGPEAAREPSTDRPAHADTEAGNEVASDASTAPDTTPDNASDLRDRVAELEDRWRRAVADLDNVRRRAQRESAAQRDEERARVSARWLPVLDLLDLALDHAASDPTTIVDGVRAIRDQALAILADLGYPRRADVGAHFDPGLHEAVAVLPAAGVPSGTVLHQVRPGYGTDEHLLRPAAVVVAKDD